MSKRKHSSYEETRKKLKDRDENSEEAERVIERHDKIIKYEMNIVTAHEIVVKSLSNIKNKYDLLHVPQCFSIRDKCILRHSHSMAHQKQYPISSHEEQLFQISYDSGMWFDALDVCRVIITPEKYPTVDVLKSIFNIILNDDEEKNNSSLVNRAVETFNFILNTHPPCSEGTRRLYGLLLCEKFDEDIIIEFLLNNILSCLESLTQNEKCNDSIITKTKVFLRNNITAISLIVEICEKDLALWTMKNCKEEDFIKKKNSFKILIVNQLWQGGSSDSVGTVYENVLKIFITLIKYNFSIHAVTVIKRFLNVLTHSFLLLEKNKTCYFSNPKQTDILGNTILNHLLSEPVDLAIAFIDYIKPYEIQYVLSEKILMHVLNSKENWHKLDVMGFIVSGKKWSTFSNDPRKYEVSRKHNETFNTNLHDLYENDIQMLYENFNEKLLYNINFESSQAENFITGVVLKNAKQKMSRSQFLTFLCQNLKYFEQCYKINDFTKIYLRKLELFDKHNKSLILEERRKFKNSYIVNSCAKECVRNFKDYKKINIELNSMRKNDVYLEEMLNKYKISIMPVI